MKKYLAFFFVILIGCKPIEPVEFDEIQNVQLDNLADNKIKISAISYSIIQIKLR